jgi:GNAT superfamily N-acetyltransferase
MSENIVILPADLNKPIHGMDVIRLLRHYASDIMGGGEDLSEFARENLISQLKKRSGVYVILAYEQDEPVGLAIAFEGFSTFYALPLINIHDLVVVEAFRGKGIARRMLNKIEETALERGCCKLTLEVLEGNERALKVYKDFGFASYQLDPKIGKALFLDKKIIKR